MIRYCISYHMLCVIYCNALQHTATLCNTMQHAATHYNTLRHTTTHCNTLQHTATHCNTLQHTAWVLYVIHETSYSKGHCSTLQHTATLTATHFTGYCNTRQHTTAHTATHNIGVAYYIRIHDSIYMMWHHMYIHHYWTNLMNCLLHWSNALHYIMYMIYIHSIMQAYIYGIMYIHKIRHAVCIL